MTINTSIYKAETEVIDNILTKFNFEKRNLPDLMSSPTCPLD